MNKAELTALFKKSIALALTSEAYFSLINDYAGTGKTTGPKQAEDLIHYTKLNVHRSKRILKTVDLDQALVGKINAISEKQYWFLLTESWCGDAANSVPIISKLTDLNEHIELRILLRDSNLELMDEYLTNGGRSIPKLIAIDEKFEELFTWGPRPKEAQELYSGWRNAENRIPYSEFSVILQKWYNNDKGISMQKELISLIQ